MRLMARNIYNKSLVIYYNIKNIYLIDFPKIINTCFFKDLELNFK